MVRRWAVLFLLAGLLAACTYPRDPRRTTEIVLQSGIMEVGVSEAEPWVVKRDDGQPVGIEVDLIEGFAQELGVEIKWIWGSQAENLEALKHHRLHVAIGGFTKQTPWARELALTSTYLSVPVIVGLPAGIEVEAQSLASQQVAVPPGSVWGAYVEEKGGIPVETTERREANMLVAGTLWEIQGWGMEPMAIRLHEAQHVMAVTRGENRWLMTLDRFLQRQNMNDLMQRLEAEAGS